MYPHFLNLVHFVGYFYPSRSHSQQLTLGLIVINCTLIAVNYCFSFLLNKMLVEMHPLPVVFSSLQPFINLIDRNKTHWNERCSIPGAVPFCISKEEWTMHETNGCASQLYGHKYPKLKELKGPWLNDLPNFVIALPWILKTRSGPKPRATFVPPPQKLYCITRKASSLTRQYMYILIIDCLLHLHNSTVYL